MQMHQDQVQFVNEFGSYPISQPYVDHQAMLGQSQESGALASGFPAAGYQSAPQYTPVYQHQDNWVQNGQPAGTAPAAIPQVFPIHTPPASPADPPPEPEVPARRVGWGETFRDVPRTQTPFVSDRDPRVSSFPDPIPRSRIPHGSGPVDAVKLLSAGTPLSPLHLEGRSVLNRVKIEKWLNTELESYLSERAPTYAFAIRSIAWDETNKFHDRWLKLGIRERTVSHPVDLEDSRIYCLSTLAYHDALISGISKRFPTHAVAYADMRREENGRRSLVDLLFGALKEYTPLDNGEYQKHRETLASRKLAGKTHAVAWLRETQKLIKNAVKDGVIIPSDDWLPYIQCLENNLFPHLEENEKTRGALERRRFEKREEITMTRKSKREYDDLALWLEGEVSTYFTNQSDQPEPNHSSKPCLQCGRKLSEHPNNRFCKPNAAVHSTDHVDVIENDGEVADDDMDVDKIEADKRKGTNFSTCTDDEWKEFKQRVADYPCLEMAHTGTCTKLKPPKDFDTSKRTWRACPYNHDAKVIAAEKATVCSYGLACRGFRQKLQAGPAAGKPMCIKRHEKSKNVNLVEGSEYDDVYGDATVDAVEAAAADERTDPAEILDCDYTQFGDERGRDIGGTHVDDAAEIDFTMSTQRKTPYVCSVPPWGIGDQAADVHVTTDSLDNVDRSIKVRTVAGEKTVDMGNAHTPLYVAEAAYMPDSKNIFSYPSAMDDDVIIGHSHFRVAPSRICIGFPAVYLKDGSAVPLAETPSGVPLIPVDIQQAQKNVDPNVKTAGVGPVSTWGVSNDQSEVHHTTTEQIGMTKWGFMPDRQKGIVQKALFQRTKMRGSPSAFWCASRLQPEAPAHPGLSYDVMIGSGGDVLLMNQVPPNTPGITFQQVPEKAMVMRVYYDAERGKKKNTKTRKNVIENLDGEYGGTYPLTRHVDNVQRLDSLFDVVKADIACRRLEGAAKEPVKIDSIHIDEKHVMKVEMLTDDACIHEDACLHDEHGYTLFAAIDVTVAKHDKAVVPTGVAIEMPDGYHGRISPHVSKSHDKDITIAGGALDPDCRGGISVIVFNNGAKEHRISKGEPIAFFSAENVTGLSNFQKNAEKLVDLSEVQKTAENVTGLSNFQKNAEKLVDLSEVQKTAEKGLDSSKVQQETDKNDAPHREVRRCPESISRYVDDLTGSTYKSGRAFLSEEFHKEYPDTTFDPLDEVGGKLLGVHIRKFEMEIWRDHSGNLMQEGDDGAFKDIIVINTWDQTALCTKMVSEFEEEYEKLGGGKLKERVSPGTVPSKFGDAAIQPPSEDEMKAGLFEETAPKWVGTSLYLVAWTRYEMGYATNSCSQKLTKWTTMTDRELIHLMGYAKRTKNDILITYISRYDISQGLLVNVGSGDAANGQVCQETQKARGHGCSIVRLLGPCTNVIHTFQSKRMTRTGTSSGEDEVCNLVTTTKLVIRSSMIADGLLGYRDTVQNGAVQIGSSPIPQELEADARVAISNALQAGTRKLEHIRRSRLIDLSFLRDYWHPDYVAGASTAPGAGGHESGLRSLLWKSGKLFVPDIGTKHLPADVLEALKQRLLITNVGDLDIACKTVNEIEQAEDSGDVSGDVIDEVAVDEGLLADAEHNDEDASVGDKRRRFKFRQAARTKYTEMLSKKCPDVKDDKMKGIVSEAMAHIGCRCNECIFAKDQLTKHRRHESKLHKEVQQRTWHVDWVPVVYPGQSKGDDKYDAIIVEDKTGFIGTEETTHTENTSENMLIAMKACAREMDETPLVCQGDSGSSELRGPVKAWVEEQKSESKIGKTIQHQPYSKWLNGRCEGKYHGIKQGARVVHNRTECPVPKRFFRYTFRWVKQSINLFGGSTFNKLGEKMHETHLAHFAPFGTKVACRDDARAEKKPAGDTLAAANYEAGFLGVRGDAIVVGQIFNNPRKGWCMKESTSRNFHIFYGEYYDFSPAMAAESACDGAFRIGVEELVHHWVECSLCKKWRMVPLADVARYAGDAEFTCSNVKLKCSAKQDPRAFTENVHDDGAGVFSIGAGLPDWDQESIITGVHISALAHIDLVEQYRPTEGAKDIDVFQAHTKKEAYSDAPWPGDPTGQIKMREKAAEAEQAEMDIYRDYAIIDWSKADLPSAWMKRAKAGERINRIIINVLYGTKNVELAPRGGAKFKVRSVACKEFSLNTGRTDDGRITGEAPFTIDLPSPTAQKLAITIVGGAGLNQWFVDIKGAYPTEHDGGVLCVASVPSHWVPEEVQKLFNGAEVWAPVTKAVYGRIRAGFDFDKACDKKLKGMNFETMKDVVGTEDRVYLR